MSENKIDSYVENINIWNKGEIESIFQIDDILKRNFLKAIFIQKATEQNMKKEMIKILNEYEAKSKERYSKSISLTRGDNGKVLSTIENFLSVMEHDEFFDNVRFNLLSFCPERIVNKKRVRWTDADDAKAKYYIEKNYCFHNESKFQDALRIFFSNREYNPVQEIIEQIKWDGQSRIFDFLSKWLGCEDSIYTREISRLLFAGGIHRIYNAGCKFDDVVVLIGTAQGEGKSSFVRWLALEDDFFGEVTEINGKEGIEALEGLWICEIAEMLATTKAKEVEAVKAYITRQNDRYRRSYDRRVTDHPRQCIFIGTTNKAQFLTDKTGNRRFYPVQTFKSGYELFDNKKEIQHDIRQCWAEALHLYKKNDLKPYADRVLKDIIAEKQEEAVEDDWRVEAIKDYLEVNECKEICILELWQRALNNGEMSHPQKKDSNEIGLILESLKGWQRRGVKRNPNGYPTRQKYWELVDLEEIVHQDLLF